MYGGNDVIRIMLLFLINPTCLVCYIRIVIMTLCAVNPFFRKKAAFFKRRRTRIKRQPSHLSESCLKPHAKYYLYTGTTQTGFGSESVCPVGVNRPLSLSMRKETTESLFWFAAST